MNSVRQAFEDLQECIHRDFPAPNSPQACAMHVHTHRRCSSFIIVLMSGIQMLCFESRLHIHEYKHTCWAFTWMCMRRRMSTLCVSVTCTQRTPTHVGRTTSQLKIGFIGYTRIWIRVRTCLIHWSLWHHLAVARLLLCRITSRITGVYEVVLCDACTCTSRLNIYIRVHTWICLHACLCT